MATMGTPNNISKDAKQVAESLLDIGSVQLKVDTPFTWVSGIKSPIYCDNRLIISHVEIRRKVVGFFVDLITSHFNDVEVIAGVATGGIPLGALIADKMNLPFIYARQTAKEYGLKKQVEGEFKKGQKVVLIEDLISTGSSSVIAANAIKDAELELMGLISIMTYGFEKALKKFSENNITFYSLCDLETILEVSSQRGNITQSEKESIQRFKNAPDKWLS